MNRLFGGFRSFLLSLGDFSLFLGAAVRTFCRVHRRFGLLIRQCEAIGVNSIGIIAVAGAFLGAVIGYQMYMSFGLFGAESLLGGTVGVVMFRELGPVFTAIMVTGRSGAAMAAELASMRISEQIDALEVMAVDPHEYLVAPRIVAGTLMLPLLGIFFCAVASVSAKWIACDMMGLDPSVYWEQYAIWVDAEEMTHTLSKAATFGFALTSLACFHGFEAKGGASAVGRATRMTVVTSLLTILLCDYFLTSMLPYRLTQWKAW